MHKKYFFIILIVTVLTYANTLLNGFVGDDDVVLVNNNFYDSWSNFPRLFSKEYILDSNLADLYLGDKGRGGNWSGSVAYRPVLSVSFFIDHWIWELNPFGYHLTNLLLHIFNVLGVYVLAFLIGRAKRVALLGALIFSVHPLRTEAVASISYRADLLSTFFVLISFLSFLYYKNLKNSKRIIVFVLSHLAFFLAVFTKEAAVVLPALMVIYDIYFSENKLVDILVKFKSRYLGFILITLFYLYVYLYAFPNLTLKNLRFLGGDWLTHIMTLSKIFVIYVGNLILPSSVHIIPPLYAPVVGPFDWSNIVVALFIMIICVLIAMKAFKSNDALSFVLLWFLVTLIPISNIIPLPNPMAYRFLNLPSVGFSIAMAIFIEQFCKWFEKHTSLANITSFFRWSIIGFCMILTIPLNMAWKDNFSMAYHMVQYYPHDPKGYLFLGLVCFQSHLVEQAQHNLEQSRKLGLQDPRLYYTLGLCYTKNNLDKAIEVFSEGIQHYPKFGFLHMGLGRVLFLKKDYEKALPFLLTGLAAGPTYANYSHLIQIYIIQNKQDEVKKLFEEAKMRLTNDKQINSLEKLMREDTSRFPIDVGF